MRCIDPRTVIFRALEAWLVVQDAADQGAHEEDLRKLGPGVEGLGADVGVYFVEGGEFGGGEG